MQIVSVGIDLGKTTFHLVALGVAGKVLVRKKFTQRQLLTYTANELVSHGGPLSLRQPLIEAVSLVFISALMRGVLAIINGVLLDYPQVAPVHSDNGGSFWHRA
jgi:hypothetical protein